MDIEAKIEGEYLTVRIKLEPKPFQVSSSNKSLVVASSHGNVRTTTMVDGSPLTIGLNAYIKNPDFKK